MDTPTNHGQPRHFEYGELTNIIIGTVVREGPIRARRLAEILNAEGIKITPHQAAVKLVALAEAGRIDRVSLGAYRGV